MDRITTDLRDYYDREAPTRAARDVDPQRTAWRTGFANQAVAEGRTRVLEIGSGPGRDAPALRDHGLTVAALDLSGEAVRLVLAGGIPAIQGSLYRLPLAAGSVGAVWSMSTLVHVPDARFDEAMEQLVEVVGAGGLIGIGLWGGKDYEGTTDLDRFDPPRFFSFRSHDRTREMLGRHGSLESFETKDYNIGDGSEYQFAILRAG